MREVETAANVPFGGGLFVRRTWRVAKEVKVLSAFIGVQRGIAGPWI
jgi:hypothetical protein